MIKIFIFKDCTENIVRIYNPKTSEISVKYQSSPRRLSMFHIEHFFTETATILTRKPMT